MMTHDLIGRTLMAPEKKIMQEFSLFFLTQHCSLRRKEKKKTRKTDRKKTLALIKAGDVDRCCHYSDGRCCHYLKGEW